MALHGKQDLASHVFLLYSLLSFLILSLLLSLVSTKGSFSLLFLDLASPGGNKIILLGDTCCRGLPAPLEECAAGLIPSFYLPIPCMISLQVGACDVMQPSGIWKRIVSSLSQLTVSNFQRSYLSKCIVQPNLSGVNRK